MTDTVDDAPSPTEVAKLLADVDQGKANHLMRAFDQAAGETGARNCEVMWALAMLQARVLAAAPMGDVQVWTAGRFAEMVRLAYPALALAVEKVRRARSGELEHDA
jgi:leucyl aminopeptidase (aminopeptidase T)